MSGDYIDEFLDDLARLRLNSQQVVVDDVWKLTADFFANNGFDKLIFIQIRQQELTLLSSMPQEWISRYHQQDYARIDPFFSYCGKTHRPISTGVAYSEEHKELTLGQRKLIAEAAEFGINAGFSSTLQLLSPSGFAGWNIGSSMPRKEVDRLRLDRELGLRLAARHAYDLLSCTSTIKQQKVLSPREWECLLLLSQGMRTKDVAHSLQISSTAVELYVRNARHKLGAKTRDHAVAIAAAKGLLNSR